MLIERNAAFTGGIHPTDGTDKTLSKDAAIKVYKPDTVYLDLAQTPSSICEALVKKGDRVTRGQLIATAKNFTAVKLHASVSGIIEDILVTPKDGKEKTTFVIKADKDQPALKNDKYFNEICDISALSSEDIISMMEDAGICGMGGAGFPTHVKFKSGKKIEYILINGIECESYLTCDYRVMLEWGYAVINGAHLFLKASGADEAIICIEDNKPDAAENLSNILKDKNLPISVKVLPTKYPQGGERQIIQAAVKREVPIGGLPAECGTIVCNVQTAKALADKVFADEPSITRVITITGYVKEPSNFVAPIGTKLSELIDECGGVTKEKNKIVLGGPMTGCCIGVNAKASDIGESLRKTDGGLLVLDDKVYPENNCIRCCVCEYSCPAGLTPWKIDSAQRNGEYDLCENLYATECIACGSCSFVCPAKRELANHIVSARDKVKAIKKERGNN